MTPPAKASQGQARELGKGIGSQLSQYYCYKLPSYPIPLSYPLASPSLFFSKLILTHFSPPSITNATSGAGNSVSDYGNGIKDWTKADGTRTQTAKNPLGTSSNSYGGKGVVTGAGSKGKSGGKGTAGNPLGLSS